jgi:MYXO-CTERM domain-containing protein
VDDLGDDYERLDLPEDDAGTRGVFMGFVPASGTLDVIGLENGTFGMDIAYALPDGQPQVSRFSSVSVSQGESLHFVLDVANACAAGTRATGAQIAPSSPCPLPPPPSSGCGCSISAVAGPGEGIAALSLALAVLAWARSRRSHPLV